MLDCGVAEELFLAQNFRVGEFGPAGSDGGVAFFDFEEPEELRGVDDGEQVIDFEGQIVGEAVNVVLSALVEEQFEEAGHAAGAGMGQHLVMHLALVANFGSGVLVAGGLIGSLRGSYVGLGEYFVDVVDKVGEGLGLAVAGLG